MMANSDIKIVHPSDTKVSLSSVSTDATLFSRGHGGHSRYASLTTASRYLSLLINLQTNCLKLFKLVSITPIIKKIPVPTIFLAENA